MCSPQVLQPLALGLQIGGGAYSAFQQNQAGKANQKYYNALSIQAEQEAGIAKQIGERRATLAEDQGVIDSKIVARNADKVAAEQQVALAANGAGGGVTAQDIVADAFDKRKLDELAVRYNADSRAWEATTDAAYKSWDALNRKAQYTEAGVNARRVGAANAASTLFSTATQVIGSALKFSRNGSGYNPMTSLT